MAGLCGHGCRQNSIRGTVQWAARCRSGRPGRTFGLGRAGERRATGGAGRSSPSNAASMASKSWTQTRASIRPAFVPPARDVPSGTGPDMLPTAAADPVPPSPVAPRSGTTTVEDVVDCWKDGCWTTTCWPRTSAVPITRPKQAATGIIVRHIVRLRSSAEVWFVVERLH
jgi:hypothetical protein